jgi:hypothetical protein
MRIAPATNHARQHRPQRSPQCVRPTGVIIGAEWLPIFLSALASGLLSLLISDVYYRVSVRSADRHHIEQLEATAKRHAEQMACIATSAVASDLSSPVQDEDDPRWHQQPRTKKIAAPAARCHAIPARFGASRTAAGPDFVAAIPAFWLS